MSRKDSVLRYFRLSITFGLRYMCAPIAWRLVDRMYLALGEASSTTGVFSRSARRIRSVGFRNFDKLGRLPAGDGLPQRHSPRDSGRSRTCNSQPALTTPANPIDARIFLHFQFLVAALFPPRIPP